MPEKICLHKPCRCRAAPESAYCSDVCHAAEQANPQGADCGCGHAACEREGASVH